MATVAQKRTLMAMYPAMPIKTRGVFCHVGSLRIARSTFWSLLNDGYIIAADKFFNDYILTDKGRAEAEKAIKKAIPAQQEMIVVPYRYYYNTEGIVRNAEGRPITRRDTTHIPSLDGYREGDELMLAYEGKIAAAADERGAEMLFAKFNAPFERPDEYAGPSMSIGDVVTFFPNTDKAISFAVDRIGFKQVDINRSEIVDRPAIWIRSGEKMVEYLKAKEEETGVETNWFELQESLRGGSRG